MIKYSRQRESILSAIADRTDHPTADTIFVEIREEYPNISKGTVYRNLALLADLGMIQKISTENGPDRFDPNVKPHSHFSCRKCGEFMDIDFEIQDDLTSQASTSFSGRIEKCTVNFSGLCPNCMSKFRASWAD